MQIKQQLIYGDLDCAKVRFEDGLKQKLIMGASDKYFYDPNQVTVPTYTLLVIYQRSRRSVHPERKMRHTAKKPKQHMIACLQGFTNLTVYFCILYN